MLTVRRFLIELNCWVTLLVSVNGRIGWYQRKHPHKPDHVEFLDKTEEAAINVSLNKFYISQSASNLANNCTVIMLIYECQRFHQFATLEIVTGNASDS